MFEGLVEDVVVDELSVVLEPDKLPVLRDPAPAIKRELEGLDERQEDEAGVDQKRWAEESNDEPCPAVALYFAPPCGAVNGKW